MSEYEFSIQDSQNLVRALIDQGWIPPKPTGNYREYDLVMKYAQDLQPIFQEYMPAYYPEGGGP